MSNIVFILGAGASQQCGAPLMNDFLDKAYRLWKTDEYPEKNEHFKKVFDSIGALYAVHSKSELDLINIESVFNTLEIAEVLGKLPGHKKQDIPGVIDSLKELIAATLEKTIKFPVLRNNIRPAEPYGAFAKLLRYLISDAHPAQTVSIITFNYDIALDLALYIERLGVDYCFNKSSTSHRLIPVLKLHGSLNWASTEKSREVTPLELGKYFQNYSLGLGHDLKTCTIPISSQLQEAFNKQGAQVESKPVIIPPTWSKLDYGKTLSKVWSRAAQELEEAECIFIIGYSLPDTDEFFRSIYALGTAGKTPIMKLVVYNPDLSGVVRERFFRMLGPGARDRFRYKEIPFNRAIPDIQSMFPKK